MINFQSLSGLAPQVAIVALFLFFGWKAVVRLAEALDRMAAATERAADEAKERNGHLAELQLQNAKANARSSRQIIKLIKEAKK